MRHYAAVLADRRGGRLMQPIATAQTFPSIEDALTVFFRTHERRTPEGMTVPEGLEAAGWTVKVARLRFGRGGTLTDWLLIPTPDVEAATAAVMAGSVAR